MPAKLRAIWVLGAGAAVVTTAMLTHGGDGPSQAAEVAPAAIGGAPLVATAPAVVPGADPAPAALAAAPAPAPTPIVIPPAAPAPALPGAASVQVAAPARPETAPAPAPLAPGAPLPATLVGDAAFAGQVDLDHLTLAGDHYEAALPGGRTAILTLDPKVQAAAEKALDRSKAPVGAIVVTATDGRILAIAGRRTDDPKGGKDGIADPKLALGAWAPAASIFKIVSASALIEAGVSPSDKVCFHGGLRSVTESNLTDGKNDGRCEDLTFAVAFSQNAIIAKLAHAHLEPKTLGAMATRLGVDGPLPAFALTGDAGQVDMPPANDLAFARTAAGFEGTKLSAMGGALLADAIATGGQAITPHIVDAVVDGGRRVPVAAPAPRRALGDDVAAQVGRMMEATCARGTAAKAFRGGAGELPGGAKVAGKTGTLARTDPHFVEYSWFVGYAPADHPSMSIAVVLGNAESWWLKGHTAARMVLGAALGAPEPAEHKARRERHARRARR